MGFGTFNDNKILNLNTNRENTYGIVMYPK